MSSRRGRGRPRHPDVLTPAEWRIVDAIRHGMSTRQIARRRGVSPDAVKFHVANVLDKLGLANRAEVRHWPGVPVTSPLAAPTGKGPDMTDSTDPPTDSTGSTGSGTVDASAARGGLSLGPIGQIARQVSDVARAEEWYRAVLGLRHLYTFGDLAFFDCGGVRLFLSSDGGEGRSAAVRAEPSVLYFRVPDIHAAYAELGARGVVFRGAPHLIHRHADGVEEWMAFFDDPDGHPLALMAQTGPTAQTAQPAPDESGAAATD